ncbi:hypothetical protein VTJ83DRAFT_1612 [Remersonia thermophila]|uniref:Uncharacterized protein n=1 Tax=Remersonia thermophila TaxID=72144 RepID=A0ABR4DGD7_9PEZI
MDNPASRSNDMMLTDDVVAEILAKEAREASAKYSTLGLEAFTSKEPSSKAKPNTRFLGNIIKRATSHNAWLREKEAAEAQARLDSLTQAAEKRHRRLNPTASDIRRRQLGAISSILQDRKRDGGDRKEPAPPQGKDHPEGRTRDRDDRRGKADAAGEKRSERRSSKRHDDGSSPEQRHGSDRHGRRRHDRSRSPRHGARRHRDRSPLSSDESDASARRSRRSKSSRRTSPKPDKDEARDLIDSRSLSKRKNRGRLLSEEEEEEDDCASARQADESDSDPLEELIGPAPPPPKPAIQIRGRGARRDGSGSNSGSGGAEREAPLNSDNDNDNDNGWDEAVEAYRDRQKWKQQGAERLRAAGFTDQQIQRWEKGGEMGIEDVRWTKAGEQREWDRGKEMDLDE